MDIKQLKDELEAANYENKVLTERLEKANERLQLSKEIDLTLDLSVFDTQNVGSYKRWIIDAVQELEAPTQGEIQRTINSKYNEFKSYQNADAVSANQSSDNNESNLSKVALDLKKRIEKAAR